jgi:hypothetical protein
MEPEKKDSQAAFQHWAAIIGAVAALITAATGTIVAIYSLKKPTSIPSPYPIYIEKSPQVRSSIKPFLSPESSPQPLVRPTESPSPISSSSPSLFPSPTVSPTVEPKKVEIPVEGPSPVSPSPTPEQSKEVPSPQSTN